MVTFPSCSILHILISELWETNTFREMNVHDSVFYLKVVILFGSNRGQKPMLEFGTDWLRNLESLWFGTLHRHRPLWDPGRDLSDIILDFFFFFNNDGPLNCIALGLRKPGIPCPLSSSLPKFWIRSLTRTLTSFII